jgi:esterase/lipase superfamily enzyme
MQGCGDSWGFAGRGSSDTNWKQVFGKFLSHNVYCSLPVQLYWNVSCAYYLNKCNKIQSITHSNQYLYNIIQNQ